MIATPATAAAPTLLDLIVGAPPGAPATSSFAELIAVQSAPSAAALPAVPVPVPVAPAPAPELPIEQADALIAQLAKPTSRPDVPPPETAAEPGKSDSDSQTDGGGAPIDTPVTPAVADAAPDLPRQSSAPAPTLAQVSPLVAAALLLPSSRTPSEPAAKAPQGASLPARSHGPSNLTPPVVDLPVQTHGDTAAAGPSPNSVFALPVAPAVSVQASTPDVSGTSAPAIAVDVAIEHRLDLAQDHVWLDQLARDISRSADANGRLRFVLSPQHLGRMTVDLAAGIDGTAVRMTTESEQARRIISDAQPRLIAEAQAQGLRISETQVLLDQRPGQQHRPDQAFADMAAVGLGGQGPSSQGSAGQGSGGQAAGHQHSGAQGRQVFAEAQERPAPKRQTAAPVPAERHLYA